MHAEAAFVHEPMMGRAEDHQIVQRRLAAFRPMPDVVRVQIPFMMATGERAAAVAREQGALERGWNRALPAPDIEGASVVVADDRCEGTIATQPAYRRQRQIRLAAAPAQCGRIDVDDHLVILAG